MASENPCTSLPNDGRGGLIVIEHCLCNPFVRVGSIWTAERYTEGPKKGRMIRFDNGFVREGVIHDDFGVPPLGRSDGPCGGIPEETERERGASEAGYEREGFFHEGRKETHLDSAVHIECLADFCSPPKGFVGGQQRRHVGYMDVHGDLSVGLDDEREGIVNVLAAGGIYVEGGSAQEGRVGHRNCSRKECGRQQTLLPRIRGRVMNKSGLFGREVAAGSYNGPTGAARTIRLFVPGLVVDDGEHVLFGFVGRADVEGGIRLVPGYKEVYGCAP